MSAVIYFIQLVDKLYLTASTLCYVCVCDLTDGQSVASRIGKQLKINSQNLAKASDNLASYGCEVSSKDLKDLDHPVYVQLQASGLNHLQQKAALAYADFERACEGEEATKKDMGLFLTCLAKKEKKLDMLICDVPLSSDQYGELHILCARRIALEQLHETCATDFAKHIAINSWVYSKSHLLETLSASSLEPTFDLQECDLVECDEVEDSSDDDMWRKTRQLTTVLANLKCQ